MRFLIISDENVICNKEMHFINNAIVSLPIRCFSVDIFQYRGSVVAVKIRPLLLPFSCPSHFFNDQMPCWAMHACITRVVHFPKKQSSFLMIWVVMPKLGRKVTGTNCPLPSEPVGNWSQQTPVGTEAAPRLIKRQYVRV